MLTIRALKERCKPQRQLVAFTPCITVSLIGLMARVNNEVFFVIVFVFGISTNITLQAVLTAITTTKCPLITSSIFMHGQTKQLGHALARRE
jgi:hypothetical protein